MNSAYGLHIPWNYQNLCFLTFPRDCHWLRTPLWILVVGWERKVWRFECINCMLSPPERTAAFLTRCLEEKDKLPALLKCPPEKMYVPPPLLSPTHPPPPRLNLTWVERVPGPRALFLVDAQVGLKTQHDEHNGCLFQRSKNTSYIGVGFFLHIFLGELQ